MATDATGTPTTLGIPTFNVDADSPSGNGTNEMVEAIDNLIVADRARLTTAEADIDALEAAGPTSPTIATSLPGSPADGDEAILVDSLTAPTYAWRFVYDTGISDSYKWVFIGGSEYLNEVAGSVSTDSTSFVIPGTTPLVTIPIAGIYQVEFETGFDGPGALGLSKNGAAPAIEVSGGSSTSGRQWGRITLPRQTLAASDTFNTQIRSSDGISRTWFNRAIHLTPVRVA